VCPLSVHSAQPAKQRFAWDPWATLRRLGAERADPKQGGTGAKRRGWGGGEAVDHPGRRGIGADLPDQRDAAVSGAHLPIAIIAVRFDCQDAAPQSPVPWYGNSTQRAQLNVPNSTCPTQRACHIDNPQAIVRQRDITRHVISPISARRAVSGSHLPIAIISVGVRLPRRGSGCAETVPVIIQKYGI